MLDVGEQVPKIPFKQFVFHSFHHRNSYRNHWNWSLSRYTCSWQLDGKFCAWLYLCKDLTVHFKLCSHRYLTPKYTWFKIYALFPKKLKKNIPSHYIKESENISWIHLFICINDANGIKFVCRSRWRCGRWRPVSAVQSQPQAQVWRTRAELLLCLDSMLSCR